ncbi:hypothetical protein H2O64_15180 [Kordia sp. YSTF-M3]|uniref:Sulfatase N-terminal domain-containing protein n=1 Tax=Kordia aestuariivivens TaxID=2759037 RepID=A0ABR7QCE8_9FLAO|nr:hypothetical protein [Kordia aestuariivivens]MBC8756019.1 hypothetical protein [Kordia aestuariivivens]
MLQKFLKNKWSYLIISAVASGLYAIIHTYGINFLLINSWTQFGILLSLYILLPILIFILVTGIVKKISKLKKFQVYVIPILNAAFFAFFIIGKTYGFNARRMVVLGIFAAICIAIMLTKHYKKIIILQLVLALVAFVKIPPILYEYATQSNEWLEQPDAIETAKFKKTPNIYVIQPDGYVSFSELKKDLYNFDNSEFETYLDEKNFKLYSNYRSNYASTILSNSSMFAMKHHYKGEQLFNAREVIAGNNPVISTLKNNDYKTFLLLEYPYLLLNRPTILYDECNIEYSEVPLFGLGAFKNKKELIAPLKKAIQNNLATRNFFFIEKIAPSHIATQKKHSAGVEGERDSYILRLKEVNNWLREITDVIVENDPNSLIVIVADHGGYIGLEYTYQLKTKLTDSDLVHAVFSSALAIKWPNNTAPVYDSTLKTNVNLFRTLFAYLSENENYLKHLEKDQSFSLIEKNAPSGVYEYIDDEGTVVFKKIEK